jgi:hypothetical protein
MPVTVTGESLTQFISGLKRQFNSPDLIQELGQALSDNLVEAFTASGLNSRSGATVEALSVVGEPQRTGTGWNIGVGNKEALGNENESAPRNTLREFYDSIGGGTGQVRKYANWQGLSDSNKALLEQGRRAGLFGGRGPKYANYMWIQNKGNPKAIITGRHFIEQGVASFQSQAPNIINEWWASLGRVGRFKRTVAGVFGR